MYYGSRVEIQRDYYYEGPTKVVKDKRDTTEDDVIFNQAILYLEDKKLFAVSKTPGLGFYSDGDYIFLKTRFKKTKKINIKLVK